MTTTRAGKRYSPRKIKSFKTKFSPKKYHSPKKTARENKVRECFSSKIYHSPKKTMIEDRGKEYIAVSQKVKKEKGKPMKAKQINHCVPFSLRLQRRGLPKPAAINIATKKAHNISTGGSPEAPKQTKNMTGDYKKLSPLDATENVVPTFELCAEFGFTGKKAEVARTLIKVQRAFNRLKFNGLPSISSYNYNSTEFDVLFRETAAMGARAVGKHRLWDQFERGLIQLLEMRLAHYKISPGTLFNSLGSEVALWNKNIYYAGTCQGPSPNSSIKIVPGQGVVRDLTDLAITLQEQIESVKEFDRADGMTEFAQKAGYY